MTYNTRRQALGGFVLMVACCGLTSANPTLSPGIWADITPPGGAGYYINDIQFAQTNHNILFACVCAGPAAGLQKSLDGGSTWTTISGTTLSSPQRVRIDPHDANHLYVTQGVSATGFFESIDGGVTMTTPAGWATLMAAIHQDNIYYISVDPTDFNHLLLAFYDQWNQTGNSGVVESTDGGNRWIVHQPRPEWASDHCGNVAFLYDPANNQGNSSTWIFSNRSAGLWRTTDAGVSWSQVTSAINITRCEYYYSKSGVLFGAANSYPIKSTDNGVTWQQLTGAPNDYYYSIQGDGNLLYILGERGGSSMTSPATDGMHWIANDSHSFCEGSATLTFDPQNQIMYSAGKTCGVWALKVAGASTLASIPISSQSRLLPRKSAIVSRCGVVLTSASGLFNVKGMKLARAEKQRAGGA